MDENNLELNEVLPEIPWLNSPEDLWNILNLSKRELMTIYPDRTWDNLRRRRNKIKQKGYNIVPDNPEYTDPQSEHDKANARRKRVAPSAGRGATLGAGMKIIQVPEEHARYHEQLQKALNEEGHLSKARFSDYQMGYKDDDGHAASHDLHASRFEVKFDTERDAIIRALQSIKIPEVRNVRPRKKEALKQPGESSVALVSGDHHFQYLRLEDGTMIPCHDEKVIELLHQVAKQKQPDVIVLGGDVFDFPQFSRWEQVSHFIDTINPTLDRVGQFLDRFREECPHSKIIWIPGNHDRRPQRLRSKSPQIEELLKAKIPGEKWPVLSIPHLLQLESRGVEYVDGAYSRYQINDRLGVEHKGNDKKSLGRKLISTIGFDGHSTNEPRPEVYETSDGMRTIYHYMLPMCGRTDGAIPSHLSAYYYSGEPEMVEMNWVQGFAMVDYLEGDQPFQLQKIIVSRHDGYKMFYNGKVYEP